MEIDPKNSAHPSDGVAASRRSERGAVEGKPWLRRITCSDSKQYTIEEPFVLIRNYLCEGDLTFGFFDYDSGYYQLSDGDGRAPEDVVACGDAEFLTWNEVEEAVDKYTRKKKGRSSHA